WDLAGFAVRWSIENAGKLAAIAAALSIPIAGRLDALGSMVDLIAAGTDYGRIGTLRADVVGRFLEIVRSALASGYERVHVVAVSFGGIVALDALFYTAGAKSTGALDADELERIGDLVTIAPPITFVQQLFPRHFDRIRAEFPHPERHRWINVCSPLDVLGTPIIDEPFDYAHWFESPDEKWWTRRLRDALRHQVRDAEHNLGDPNNILFGVKRNVDFTGWYPLDVTWYELLSLTALRAHGWYWNPGANVDFNAFDRVVQLLELPAVGGPPRIALVPNRLWIRGGGVRDGSPIPAGAYPRRAWPNAFVPDVLIARLDCPNVELTHKIVWPPWAGMLLWETTTVKIDLQTGLARVDVHAPALNGQPTDVRLWRPHLHCIELRAAESGRSGSVTLRCDRRRCYLRPAGMRLTLAWHR
ncbi:MAG TPA: hypothetical protein VHT53_09910, partial [Candidatus Elarobacter sp.]|nr:hypothetical protein [Candidatus Elarobacter sp.]